MEPRKGPGGAISYNCFLFLLLLLFFFFSFLFMSLPGHQIFIFWPVEIVPHEICDIWCCEMPDERYVIDVLVSKCWWFQTKWFTGLLELLQLCKQKPLEKFLIFPIYQICTLALKSFPCQTLHKAAPISISVTSGHTSAECSESYSRGLVHG